MAPAEGGRELSAHYWVQCYVKDRWVDFDAALDGFDVTHLALWIGAAEVDTIDLLRKLGHLKAVQVELDPPSPAR